MTIKLDHVVFGCLDLEAGARALTEVFGAPPAGRGRHGAMSTHNALWNMGEAYFELVAIDPDAPPPGRPRWFGLDEAETRARLAAGPRFLTWVAATDDAPALAARAPKPFGAPEDFARDDLRWRMAVPLDGAPPMSGCFPAPIEWIAGVHPARRLGDQGLRCRALTISHPDISLLEAALTPLPPSVSLTPGPVDMALDIDAPNGALSFRAFD